MNLFRILKDIDWIELLFPLIRHWKDIEEI